LLTHFEIYSIMPTTTEVPPGGGRTAKPKPKPIPGDGDNGSEVDLSDSDDGPEVEPGDKDDDKNKKKMRKIVTILQDAAARALEKVVDEAQAALRDYPIFTKDVATELVNGLNEESIYSILTILKGCVLPTVYREDFDLANRTYQQGESFCFTALYHKWGTVLQNVTVDHEIIQTWNGYETRLYQANGVLMGRMLMGGEEVYD
jgi:hypothetical protein